MQTHDQTYVVDDFIVGPQIEEFAPLIDEKREDVARHSVTPHGQVFGCVLRACVTVCVGVIRSLERIANAIRWASEPRKRPAPRKAHPGLVLEFVVFGIFVVCAAMGTLLS